MPAHAESDLPTPLLILVAAPLEGAPVLRAASPSVLEGHPRDSLKSWYTMPLRETDRRIDLALTRVGKAMAAGCAARLLTSTAYAGVVNLGICGSLPPTAERSKNVAGQSLGPIQRIGTPILARYSVMGDEGLIEPGDGGPRFTTIDAMGFPAVPAPNGEGSKGGPDPRRPADPALASAVRTRLTHAGLEPITGTIATVSTCSGTDAAAREVVRRTGAIAEAMEGAAIAQVCAILGVPFVELRVISNTTGDRAAQEWDIPRAIGTLERVAAALLA